MDTPFRDFAGSTVVHTVGGVLALCGAIALGPRLGRKFKRDGGGMPPGHNMTLAALGARHPLVRLVRVQPRQHALGDGLRGHRPDRDQHDPRRLCRCARRRRSGSTPRSKKCDVGISINGLLAGLVAITCPCYWVSPTGSIAIGAIAGVDHDPRRRLHRVDPGRRPLRGVRRARCLRHLGHAEPRACSPSATTACRVRRAPTPRRSGHGPALRRERQPARRPDQGQRDDHRVSRSPPACW